MDNLIIKITAIIIKDGKILLIKEKNTTNDKYYWDLVKGTFEPQKDRGIFDTVIRECREEINTKIKIEKLINIIYYRKKSKIRFQFNFLCSTKNKCSILSNQVNQKSRDEDIIEIKFFSKFQITKMRKGEFMDERIYMILHDFLQAKAGNLPTLKEIIKL